MNKGRECGLCFFGRIDKPSEALFWVMPVAFLEKLSFEEIEDIIKDLRIAVTPSMDAARASGSRLALAQAVAISPGCARNR